MLALQVIPSQLRASRQVRYFEQDDVASDSYSRLGISFLRLTLRALPCYGRLQRARNCHPNFGGALAFLEAV